MRNPCWSVFCCMDNYRFHYRSDLLNAELSVLCVSSRTLKKRQEETYQCWRSSNLKKNGYHVDGNRSSSRSLLIWLTLPPKRPPNSWPGYISRRSPRSKFRVVRTPRPLMDCEVMKKLEEFWCDWTRSNCSVRSCSCALRMAAIDCRWLRRRRKDCNMIFSITIKSFFKFILQT